MIADELEKNAYKLHEARGIIKGIVKKKLKSNRERERFLHLVRKPEYHPMPYIPINIT